MLPIVGQIALATEETYFWSTLVLAITLVAVLILFFYKMFISPRQVIVSLEKASSGIFVADPSPTGATAFTGKSAKPGTGQSVPGHNWHSHLTLSLGVLSTALALMLGWDFENNIYAQEWVNQNLAEVGLITFVVIVGVILLPLAMILLMGFLGREKPLSKGQAKANRSKKA